ncbi:MAG: GGDEF domain-containing protein, partial [Burkholderiales bacterium]|nr:GGDEF domain-containing protein [Burkholderiales bacterium]
PLRSLDALQLLRERSTGVGQLGQRWRIDEVACRVHSDLDNSQAIAVADAGLALATGLPAAADRPAWWRLRACRVGALLQAGQRAQGEAELGELLETTPEAPPAGSAAWAMVRLERGVDRTRRSDPVGAQEDLVSACEVLRQLQDRRDLELCLGQLANHYRRIGDTDEALRLFVELLGNATRRGEHYDASIHAYNLATVQAARGQWAESLTSARAAEQASIRLNDRLGQGYAGRPIASALARTGHLPQALARIELALRQIDREADGREHEAAGLLHAELLNESARHAEALARIEDLRQPILQRGEQTMQQQWHQAHAVALAGLGRWRDAYEARTHAERSAAEMHQRRLSEQAARMGKQFLRARDAQEMSVLRELADRERQLRQTQAVALALFGLLLSGLVVLALRKIRQVRRLQQLATTDELTGLLNRRAVLDHALQAVAQAERKAQSMALLMVDIDHFKRINDEHGHPVGDAVLQHAGQVLQSALRAGDHLGRLGGEEFVAVLSDADEKDARRVAERMRQAILDSPLPADGGPLLFTTSVGVATWQPGDTVQQLVERSDAALYRAKRAGRNVVAG